jgi:hypothetical protein
MGIASKRHETEEPEVEAVDVGEVMTGEVDETIQRVVLNFSDVLYL